MTKSVSPLINEILSVKTNEQTRCIEIQVAGVLKSDDVIHLLEQIKAAQPENQVYSRLYDFSEIDIDVSVQEFDRILSHAQKLFKVRGVIYKAAFVALDPFVRQLAELYKSASRPYGFNDIECFSSVGEAKAWLAEK
ncbi:STAS/SEC14 domain-containing protein [Pleionea litopenaei]|uniref:SpoIIAA-like protein n=1 Tax=Pleionea litopenaei TaxID=3070815 RepID=A0AA51RQI1_9GAMM|nr:hypothetical protein [Pleionea sp. HL-JVS1]WMS85678.1 hypothetical protein Q9312_10675 [Pleionea sp. HL-JVS1]